MLQTEDDVICINNEGQEGRFFNFINTVVCLFVTEEIMYSIMAVSDQGS